jgi:hypothetical protein
VSSYVAIANLAATTIGTAARLTAPGDDTTLGRAVASVWEIERQAALRDGAWNFAMRRASLPQLVEAPAHGFAARYQLPADCIRLIEIYELRRDEWQVEGEAINADHTGPLKIRYLADITEPAAFDALFVKAFALRIACAIGNRIAGSSFKEELNWEKYKQALGEARRVDAMENPPIEQHESSWIESRWQGYAADPLRLDGFGY